MTSSSNADACYPLNGSGGEGSEETIICTIGAYNWARYDWSTILCGGRAYMPDFCTAARMRALSNYSSNFPFT